MRILLVSTSTSGGGAANACLRLFDALRAIGVEVRLLAMQGKGDDGIEILAHRSLVGLRYRVAKAAERLQILAHCRGQKTNLWRLSTAAYGIDISTHPWVRWADVVHLHWVSHGFLSLTALRRLAQLGKPIVWTLHDLWSITGGCHLPLHISATEAHLCPRLSVGCGVCPLLGVQRLHDLTERLLGEKAFLAQAPFHYIAVSRAERELLRHSPHFGDVPVSVIAPPMPLSMAHIMPFPSPEWYDPSRLYLLFVSARLDDMVKGEVLLREVTTALACLAPSLADRLTLLLVGEHKGGYRAEAYSIHSIYIGTVRRVEQMATLYQLATLTLSTSLFETFGQTLTEALGCGCPVVSFASGGPEDIVRSGENGYLVPAYDVEEYARAVLRVLEDVARGRLRPEVCVASVEGFAPEVIARRHIELYASCLGAAPVAIPSREKRGDLPQ